MIPRRSASALVGMTCRGPSGPGAACVVSHRTEAMVDSLWEPVVVAERKIETDFLAERRHRIRFRILSEQSLRQVARQQLDARSYEKRNDEERDQPKP